MKVVVLGASGLLGTALVPELEFSGFDAISLGRSSGCDYICDIGNALATKKILNELLPDIIVNLVALTNVDECEKNPNNAFKINVHTLENVVSWIEQHSKACHLIQISTDQVYDRRGPHGENNVMLTNYYAFSKYAAELVALRVPSTILRTNFFGKSNSNHRLSFSDWLYNSLRSSIEISLFRDVYFSPLSIKTVCELVVDIIRLRPDGIYNLGSREGLSKASFALIFAEKLKLNAKNATVTSIEDVNFVETYRPKDMRLNVSRIESKLGITLPTLKDEIEKVIGDYNEQT